MNNNITKIKGFYDLISPASDKYSYLEQKARDIFSLYGYNEIRIPLLEKTELFARSIGNETDIVQKEMYTFSDRKDRSIALRPEATAGVVRAYIENKLFVREQISRLFTFGPMFRYERPQKGRQRQFHQINVEIFGSSAPQADAELITMLWHYLTTIGISNIELEVNSLGCPKCRSNFQQVLNSYLSNLGTKDLCPDCQRRSKTNPLRIFDCKVSRCQEIIANSPSILDYICNECKDHFDNVLDIIKKTGLYYKINPRLVRGLDYYQRTTFEFISSDIGAQSAIAGGGRYDGLVKELGGPDIPGMGFACGMERLALLLKDIEVSKLDFYLASIDEQALNQAQIIGNELRKRGFSVQISFEAKSLKSQLRLANKLNVKKCLLLGQEEMKNKLITVKDMYSGDQFQIKQENLEQLTSQ